jgi:hypothetical protein
MPRRKKTVHEQQAEELFRKYKDLIINLYGRGPLDDTQIEAFGKAAFENWQGVGGQESFDPPLRPGSYIVNSSYSPSSPGKHWVALHVTRAGTPYTYDSFARSGARILHHLNGRRGGSARPLKNSDRSDAEQRGSSAVCGHLSLAWLLVVRDLGVRKAALI